MTQPIELNERQRETIFQATGRRVAAIVCNTRGVTLRNEISEIADTGVLGAFVSLKKQGNLRSCMGCMAESYPLADAIDNAAARSAKDDPRFPPITPGELLELEMEIWILWDLKKCNVPASERLQAVQIGRDGIVFEKGNYRGLLLPGVAVEHKMNVQEFLEAGCQKAGLPKSAWQDDSVQLSTFEGLAIGGPFYDVKIEDEEALTAIGRQGPLKMMIRPKTGPTMEDVLLLNEFTKNNFILCSRGLTPMYYMPEAFDGEVAGVSLTIDLPDRPQLVCSKISLQGSIPLQGSLYDVMQILVQQVNRIGATDQERGESRIELSVYWDPVDYGSPESGSDWRNIDGFRRSFMLLYNDQWVLQFNPDVPIEGVLKDALSYLNVPDASLAKVMSFETVSTTQHIFASNVSKPILGQTQRQPAVAGVFYPSDPEMMNAELDRMLAPGPATRDGIHDTNKPRPQPLHGAQVPPGQDPSGGIAFGKPGASAEKKRLPRIANEFYAAAMVPHAGWIYSGRLAAQTLVKARFPETAIIFCPKHRGGGPDWAVAPNRTWILPGTNVETDMHLAREIVESVAPMQFDAVSHAQEHAIEVQLPILARLAPKTKIVAIAMHGGVPEMIEEAATQFAQVLRKQQQMPLLIISTDMNHYASEESTRNIDRLALDAIESLDPWRLFDTVAENRISMCGALAAVFVMRTLQKLDLLNECVPIGYTTSAETSGDKSRVVGYAGMLFR